MKEKITEFLKKSFGSLSSSVFSLLLTCSLILNIVLFLDLGYNTFDKIILATCAGCVQFMGIILLLKAKKFFVEKYSGLITNPWGIFFMTLITKRVPAIIFLTGYLIATSVSLGASYSFSLKSIYKSSIKNELIINNDEIIKIKEDSIKAKDEAIEDKKALRTKLQPSEVSSDNSELILDYTSKITASEKRISSLRDDLAAVQNQKSNTEETSPNYNTLVQKEKNINASIASENKNVLDYTSKKRALINEDNKNINDSKKNSDDYQKKYDLLSDEIELLALDKIKIQNEIVALKQEDEKRRKDADKSQYQLMAENLSSIFYKNEEVSTDGIVEKKEIKEEQVRAILLGVFSLMMELGIFVTSPMEKKEEEKQPKKKVLIKLDKTKKKEEDSIVEKTEIESNTPEPPSDEGVLKVALEEEPVIEETIPIEVEEEKHIEESIPEIVSPIIEEVAIASPPPVLEEEKKEENKHMKIMSLEREVEKMMGETPVTVKKINI